MQLIYTDMYACTHTCIQTQCETERYRGREAAGEMRDLRTHTSDAKSSAQNVGPSVGQVERRETVVACPNGRGCLML